MFAIGLERLLKVLIFLVQWQRSHILPTNEDLKRLGHDLEKLYHAVKAMFAQHNVVWPVGFEPDDLDRFIVDFRDGG